MNSLKRYEDLKFAIRCVDIWKDIKPSDEELEKVLEHEIEIKNGAEPKSILCQPLQDYLEMLIALVHEETGEWFFYVDIAGILHDFIRSGDLSVYKTKSGYCVCFRK
ncbi:MAG: hypothetical protein ACXVHO_04055 [Methanobacterium sp.]